MPYQFIKLPSNPNGRKIGLYGGSFNPAHIGHLHLSLQAIKSLGLDEVWWVISPQNPLKTSANTLPLKARLKTINHLVNHPKIKITTFETQLNSNFTADNLAYLCKRSPSANFVWLMGADNLNEISKWQHWQRIFKLMPVAVFDRSSGKHAPLNAKAAIKYNQHRISQKQSFILPNLKTPAWCFIHMKRINIASSDIRNI